MRVYGFNGPKLRHRPARPVHFPQDVLRIKGEALTGEIGGMSPFEAGLSSLRAASTHNNLQIGLAHIDQMVDPLAMAFIVPDHVPDHLDLGIAKDAVMLPPFGEEDLAAGIGLTV